MKLAGWSLWQKNVFADLEKISRALEIGLNPSKVRLVVVSREARGVDSR